MSDYTHDDAMRDLGALRNMAETPNIFPFAGERTDRLDAFITQLQADLAKCRAESDSLTKQLDFVTQERDNAEKWGRVQKADLERERLRLAACSGAALGYLAEGECADEYHSASLGDVFTLSKENERTRADLAKCRALWEAADPEPPYYAYPKGSGESPLPPESSIHIAWRERQALREATRHLFSEGGDE